MMTMDRKKIYDIIGWYGAAAVLFAYGLASLGYATPNDLSVMLLNVTGGLGLAALSMRQKAHPLTAINLVWAVIALVAFFR